MRCNPSTNSGLSSLIPANGNNLSKSVNMISPMHAASGCLSARYGLKPRGNALNDRFGDGGFRLLRKGDHAPIGAQNGYDVGIVLETSTLCRHIVGNNVIGVLAF